MSLSNAENRPQWGTIFMGPGPNMETSLEKVESGRPSLAWTTGTEEEYLQRVRAKAADKAKEIIKTAQAEAEALRQSAQAQGYNEGLAQAQAELENFRQGMGESVAAVLSAIKAEAPRIALAWRNDLAELLRTCVETVLNYELDARRRATLTALLDNALLRLVEEQRVNIVVNPDDHEAVADMVDAAGKETGRVFTVRADAQLPPGSMVLESEQSRVDNSFSVRRALVERILAELTLPADTPQEAAAGSGKPAASQPPAAAPEQNFDAPQAGPEAQAAAEQELDRQPEPEPAAPQEADGNPLDEVAQDSPVFPDAPGEEQAEAPAAPPQETGSDAAAAEPEAPQPEPDLAAMSESELLAEIMDDAALQEVPLPDLPESAAQETDAPEQAAVPQPVSEAPAAPESVPDQASPADNPAADGGAAASKP